MPSEEKPILLRIEKTREFLEKKRCSGCLVCGSANISWLVGLPHTEGLLLLTKKEAYLFVSPLSNQANLHEKKLPVELITEEKKFRALVNCCRKVGYLAPEITVERLAHWKRRFTCTFLAWPDFILNLRAVKDSLELKLLRKARIIARKILKEIVTRYVRSGVEEVELAEEIRHLTYVHGATGSSFPPIVASGPNSAYPHHRPERRRLKEGEVLIIDLGVEYEGYHSDLTETVFAGKKSPDLECLYQAVAEAQKRCLEKIRAGLSGQEIHQLAASYFQEKGLAKYFVHGLGHGLGLQVHEKPVLNTRSKDLLQPGMVVTVEPGLYLPGTGGVRLEEMVFL